MELEKPLIFRYTGNNEAMKGTRVLIADEISSTAGTELENGRLDDESYEGDVQIRGLSDWGIGFFTSRIEDIFADLDEEFPKESENIIEVRNMVTKKLGELGVTLDNTKS